MSRRPPWQKKLNSDRESSARDVGRQRRRCACAAFQSRARGEDAKVIGVGILQVRQEWSATVTGRSKLWTRYRTWPLSFSGPVTRTISCCRRRRHRSVVKGAPVQICESRLVVVRRGARPERTSLRVERRFDRLGPSGPFRRDVEFVQVEVRLGRRSRRNVKLESRDGSGGGGTRSAGRERRRRGNNRRRGESLESERRQRRSWGTGTGNFRCRDESTSRATRREVPVLSLGCASIEGVVVEGSRVKGGPSGARCSNETCDVRRR